MSLISRLKAVKKSPEIEKICVVVTQGLLAIEVVIFSVLLTIDINQHIMLMLSFWFLVTSMPLVVCYLLITWMGTKAWMSWMKYPIWYAAAYSGFIALVLLILFKNIAASITFAMLVLGIWLIYVLTHK